MSLSTHARRRIEQQAAELVDRRFPGLDAPHRRVLPALLARTAEGWQLLVRRNLGTSSPAAAFLIGPGGVFAILITEQQPDEPTMRDVLRHAEERFAGITGPRGRLLAGSAMHIVVIGPPASRDTTTYWSLPIAELPRLFQWDATHLNRRQIDSIAEQATARLPEYRALRVRPPERGEEPAGLMDARDLTEDQLAAAMGRPFDSWLTFLHPQQHAIVSRNYNGPARISGPAGTGKTVVALHRLRHLARRATGPLLFTTFVRTLPAVHEAAFQRLAPELTCRVEFTNLHAWVRRFLAGRDVEAGLDSREIRTALSRAWIAHREALESIEPSFDYWHTELDRVIKGRGIRDFEEYDRAERRGRAVRLGTRQKERVWRFYQEYQQNLAERALHDYNDVLDLALRELAQRPLAEPYAAVVVDEVQDITLTGLRLLRELAGDGQNRLLLVGDGQQQVYPGGWRLSDTGIPIQGRGEVLRVNYRNRAEVLKLAQRFDANNQVDDLDGAAGVALGQVDSANPGGEIRTWRGTESELAAVLLDQLNGLPVPRGEAALIVFQHRDRDRCMEILRRAGVPTLTLDNYVGKPDDRLKIGTVHRAKGLDFRAVLVVQFAQHDTADDAAEQERRELRGRQHLVAATRARDFLWWGVVGAAQNSSDEPVFRGRGSRMDFTDWVARLPLLLTQGARDRAARWVGCPGGE